MVSVVPELGSGGWVTEPLKQLDLLFSHIVESDYSQSTIFDGEITSIPYIVSKFEHNQAELATEMETALKRYFGRYFESVNIKCTTTDIIMNGEDPAYTLNIGVTVTRYGKFYDLTKIMSIKDGKVNQVVKEINQ